MTSTHEKIRVLLIDDDPSGLLGQEPLIGDKRHFIPCIYEEGDGEGVKPELASLFDLRWLATSRESREFRDLSMAVASRSPKRLGVQGWVPEIVCFDYAMTGVPNAVRDRGFPPEVVELLSPLGPLRECAESLDLNVPIPPPVPDTGSPKNADNHGLFAGGMIFSTFSDHPCAPVATTVKGSEATIGTEAAFFEWMLEHESHGTFTNKGRQVPSWNDLLCSGMPALRMRLVQLVKAGIVQVALNDLLALAVDGSQPTLTVCSRYGHRRYPVAGLFIDKTEDPSQWALGLLQSAWWDIGSGDGVGFDEGVSSLAQGRSICDKLWHAYDSEEVNQLFEDRIRLSEMLALGEAADHTELEGHLRTFGIAGVPDPVECSKATWDLRDLATGDAVAQRWAVLFCIVRLLARRVEALRLSHEWPEEVLHRERLAFDKPIDADDLYALLFPIAKNPLVLPYHSSDPSAAKNAWQAVLSRLGINLKKLANGSQRLRIGEAIILRMFAAEEDIGYDLDNDDCLLAKALAGQL